MALTKTSKLYYKVHDYILIILGCSIYAFAWTGFILSQGITKGGLAGISTDQDRHGYSGCDTVQYHQSGISGTRSDLLGMAFHGQDGHKRCHNGHYHPDR